MELPFRLGATSYIIPAGLLANARYLAERVQDMELVLFDLDDGRSNLPTPAEVEALNEVARQSGLSFTVHLPLDLRMAEDGSAGHISLEKARKVIDCTRGLQPWAYVAHLDGRAVLSPATTPAALRRWQAESVQVLALVSAWAGGPRQVALENLEGYPLGFHAAVLERIPVSRTVDIGHLWLDGHDPLPVLREALPRMRVIHLHGLQDGRDHRSLAQVPPEGLRAVLDELIRADYSGVLTLEMFSQEDFLGSLAAIYQILPKNRLPTSRLPKS